MIRQQGIRYSAMVRPIIAAFLLIMTFGFGSAYAQQPVAFKNFASFRGIVPGIDFYASNRQAISAYEKPASETITRLKKLFGENLPKGAIFVCSTLEQKDAVYEPKVLKSGYGWSLTAVTPAVRMQEIQARIKAQMGGQIPAEFLERMKKMPQDMAANAEKQMASTVTQQIAYAILQTMLDPDLQYRSSRLDDMSKSPLPDWLDIGIASFASGANNNVSFLQQNMEQTFPIEDVLSMARPFVASSSGQNGGGGNGGGMPRFGGSNGGSGGMPSGGAGGFSGRSMGGFPSGGMGGFGGGGFSGPPGGQGGQRGGPQRVMPKDEQDRMLFDSQSSTFFSYMLEKVGIEKMKELVKEAVNGKESWEYVSKPDVLGTDFEKIESDWVAWVKNQKSQGTMFGRVDPQ
jgi:hypothetical protein